MTLNDIGVIRIISARRADAYEEGYIMWSRTSTEDERKELARLSALRGTPVDYSGPDAPQTDPGRKIYRGQPPFSCSERTREVLEKIS
jgi:hypothetical protein